MVDLDRWHLHVNPLGLDLGKRTELISRCQRFDFRRITTADIVGRLRQVADGEKLKIDEKW